LPGEPLWIGFAYANGHSHGDGSSVGNAHSNGYINGSSVGNAHSNGDGNWCAVHPDTQTSSHLAAAPIDCAFRVLASWVAGIVDAGLSNPAHFRSAVLAEYRNPEHGTKIVIDCCPALDKQK
jgi:hypothetical protein